MAQRAVTRGSRPHARQRRLSTRGSATLPDAVPNRWKDKPVEPARRVIYAYYALLQEIQGEPDVDSADAAKVEKIIRDEGIARAYIRSGSALTRYRNEWPPVPWYRDQAPESWTSAYEALLRAGSEEH
ncbi:hypothetical protein [Gordonia sputi]|uniref:hypothetical protein n=1 Tax=Gordonia sputi TaxID=36823 RepID=UPI0020439DD7|nr:hypothetical protein [Gordonia sputi]MCM3898071.1 hypothetical protein [Gordonia sputi]